MGGRVVITGGTGFIGRALSSRLAAAGREVTALTRDPASAPAIPGVAYARWDGKTAAGWLDAADGAAAIVNLAGDNIGEGRWTAAKKDRMLRSRLDAGAAVTDAVARAARKPAMVVQASAIGAYGDRGDEVIDDSGAPGGGFLADVCRQWEGSTASIEASGVRRVVVRTGVVLGHGGFLGKLALPFRLFGGGPQGSGAQFISWIQLDDAAQAIELLIGREDLDGAFNLTAPSPCRNRDFMKALGAALGRPSWLPAPAFALGAALGEMADELVLAGQNVVPARLLAAGFAFSHTDLPGALQASLG